MSLDFKVMSNERKLRCGEAGCGFATWNEVAFHHHSETDHVDCSCGRRIVETNYGRHAAREVDCHPAWESVEG
ncbi:MAG: hypothetical protein ACXWE5_13355 [Actinomycetota bacterium]